MAETAIACTRTLYVGDDNSVITGRNMDWEEDIPFWSLVGQARSQAWSAGEEADDTEW
jgi:penicillin V acylase-like amidase (Ntn superfamily)